MVGFRLEWLDQYLAHPVARHHLDLVGYQLGCGVVLVRSNEETRDGRGVAQVPLPDSRGGHSFLAMDRQDLGGKSALAVWQPRDLRAGGSCPSGEVVDLVGAHSSRPFRLHRYPAEG